MKKIPKVAQNTLFLYALTFSNYFIGLLLYPYISRVLSVEQFGLVGFSMSYALIFQVIVEFGFMISSTASIARSRDDKDEVSHIVSSTMAAKFLLSAISLLAFFISAVFVEMVREHLLIVSLFVVSSVVAALLPDFFFRGIEKMSTITVRTVIVRVVSLLLVVLFVHGDEQIIWVPLSFIIGNVLALVATFVALFAEGTSLQRVYLSDVMLSIKNGSLFFFSRLAVSLNSSLGSFFLGLRFMPTSLQVGFFAGASKISSASEMMLSPLTDSLYPHMVKEKNYSLFKKILVRGTLLWAGVIGLAMILADPICGIILGERYVSAGAYLRILLFNSFLAFPNMMLGYPALSPIGKSNHANTSTLVSTGINLVICGILWSTGSINLLTVCMVVASTNVTMLIYRATVFLKSMREIKVL